MNPIIRLMNAVSCRYTVHSVSGHFTFIYRSVTTKGWRSLSFIRGKAPELHWTGLT
uniref:Uncharacterized protein n=1 Tax=Dulem virus 42 TaxID=3145760 RepID=A0AAU8BA24_9CAUD